MTIEKKNKILAISCIIAYSLVVIWIYFFKCNIINDLRFFRWESSFQWNPIRGIFTANGVFRHKEVIVHILNIVGFLGVGGLFSYLFKKKYRYLFAGLIVILFSTLLEVAQYITSFGSPQLIDIITNSLGGFLGILLFNVLENRLSLKTKNILYLVILIISIICIILGIIFTSIRWNEYIS